MPNRLSKARSPYLRKAAEQPVDWHEWGAEAFARSRTLDRPILLSVGGVWCHWCHVMAHESFGDSGIASFINEHFIPIKVDRDERPDIDRRYQDAVQRISGTGGWPLTAFLTPDGKAFFGGTYFPPDERWGRIGFRTLLRKIDEAYREERQKIEEAADELFNQSRFTSSLVMHDEPVQDLAERAAEAIMGAVDRQHGGIGGAPKFHHASTFEFLEAQWYFTRDEKIGDAITMTLDAMARGGIYDHLLGGFFRYSTDERWIVPHFEKMLSDNAELLKLYSIAARSFDRGEYRVVVDGIVAYYLKYGMDPEGGFYASQDADVGVLDEGGYYTFTLEEVKEILSPEELEVMIQHFDLSATGDMPHDGDRNVLYTDRDAAEVARLLHRPQDMVDRLIVSAKGKLLAFREERRECPFIDRTLYANANGLMIEALCRAAALLDRPDYLALGHKTADRLIRDLYRDNALMHCEGIDGFAEDYLFFGWALMALFQQTGRDGYLKTGRALIDSAISRFWDEESGGFRDAAAREEGYLRIAIRNIQDTPNQSANGAAPLILLQLAALTGEDVYAEYAEKTLRAFAALANQHPAFSGSYLKSLVAFRRGVRKIETGRFFDQAIRDLHPFSVVLRADVKGVVICEKQSCRVADGWPPEA